MRNRKSCDSGACDDNIESKGLNDVTSTNTARRKSELRKWAKIEGGMKAFRIA